VFKTRRITMNEQAKDLLIQSQRKEIEGLGNQIQELKDSAERHRKVKSLADIVYLDAEDHALVHGDPALIQGEAKEGLCKTHHRNGNALETVLFGISSIGKLMWHAGEKREDTIGDENHILLETGSFLESLGELAFELYQIQGEIQYGLKSRIKWELEQAKGGVR
jgi:hypothetical protein